MSRPLLIIAAAGFALCALCFTLAFLVAGDRIFRDDKPFAAVKPLIDLATRKEWKWDGGDTLAVNAPVVLHYQSDGPRRVTVTGPADLLNQVRVGGGQIGADEGRHYAGHERLQAVVSGVPIRKFSIHSHEQLELGHIDQDDLDLRINGSGRVSANGKVKQLNLVIAGSGNADLGRLAAENAKVAVLGSGMAILAPRLSLYLTMAGSGMVRLVTHPANIEKTMIGSAELIEADGSAPPPVPPPMPRMPAMPAMPPMPPVPPSPGAHADSSASASSNAERNILVHGSGHTDLGHLEQGDVRLTLTGSGSTRADGQVDRLTLMVGGSGNANLGALSARQVNVTVSSSGDATIAPQDEAQITIMGSGNVYLKSKPARIEQTILGSGKVVRHY
jgi:Putative auto-transporter adhesin, head GIN domain